MVKKVLILVVAMIMMLTSVVGCQKTEKNDTEGTGGNSETTTQTNESKDEKEEAAVEPKEISFYGFWASDERLAEYEAVASRFEEENPGVNVTILNDNWGEWSAKLPTLAAANDLPDVILIDNGDIASFAAGERILDLSQYLGKDEFDKYYPGVLSMYTWENKNVAIPFTTDCRVLFYNKELFAQAGLDPEIAPTTYAEFVAAAKATTMDTNNDGTPDVYGYGLDMGLPVLPGYSLYTASNESLVDAETQKASVNTPGFIEFVQMLIDMKDYYPADFSAINHGDVAKLFAQNKVAMILTGPFAFKGNSELLDNPNVGVALVPRKDQDAPYGSWGGGFGLAVTKDSEYPELAAKLAQMMASPEYNSKLMTDFPASDVGLEQSPFKDNPNYAIFFEQLKYVRQNQPKTLFYKEIEQAAHDIVAEAINGKYSAEDAAVMLDKKINEFLSK